MGNKPYKVKHDWKGEGQPEPKLSKNGVPMGRPLKHRYSANWGGKREGSGRKKKELTDTIAFRVPYETKLAVKELNERGFKPRDIFLSAIRDLCKTLGL
jgi:hypothetical protein